MIREQYLQKIKEKIDTREIVMILITVIMVATSVKAITVVSSTEDSSSDTAIVDMISTPVLADDRPTFNKSTDIKFPGNITTDDVRIIIEYYTAYSDNTDSIFSGKAAMFYSAATEYNINPVVLLIDTAITYGWDLDKNGIDLTGDRTDVNEEFCLYIKNIAANLQDSYNNGYTTIEKLEAVNSDWSEIYDILITSYNLI